MKELRLTPTELIELFSENVAESKYLIDKALNNSELSYEEKQEFQFRQEGFMEGMLEAIKVIEVNTFDK